MAGPYCRRRTTARAGQASIRWRRAPKIFSNHAQALVEAQDWAWNTVFWGFCFALVFGAGSRPYLWRGQTTPGSWEKVEAE